jgi:hypothetical protein
MDAVCPVYKTVWKPFDPTREKLLRRKVRQLDDMELG